MKDLLNQLVEIRNTNPELFKPWPGGKLFENESIIIFVTNTDTYGYFEIIDSNGEIIYFKNTNHIEWLKNDDITRMWTENSFHIENNKTRSRKILYYKDGPVNYWAN